MFICIKYKRTIVYVYKGGNDKSTSIQLYTYTIILLHTYTFTHLYVYTFIYLYHYTFCLYVAFYVSIFSRYIELIILIQFYI